MPTFMCSFLAATPAPSCSLCPLWLFSVLSVLNSEKLNTVVTKNHREIDVSLSVFGSSASPPGPQCSLWLFSVLSVPNSEKLNTEVTKNHRGPQRNWPSSFRRLGHFPPISSLSTLRGFSLPPLC